MEKPAACDRRAGTTPCQIKTRRRAASPAGEQPQDKGCETAGTRRGGKTLPPATAGRGQPPDPSKNPAKGRKTGLLGPHYDTKLPERGKERCFIFTG